MTNKKIISTICVLLTAVSFEASAQYLTMAQYGTASDSFKKYFNITDGGIVEFNGYAKTPSSIKTKMGDNNSVTAYSLNDKGAVDWYVGSKPCSQNKSFTCVSVYNLKETQDKGNKQNPFGSDNQKGDYTLLRINKKNPKDSSVVSCSDTNFISQKLRDDAKLNDCYSYSKQACDDWKKAIEADALLINDLYEKENSCKELLSNGEKLRKKMNTLFQSGLTEAQSDVQSHLSDAVKADNLVSITADAKITPNTAGLKITPVVSVISTAMKHTEACGTYSSLFDGSIGYKNKLARIIDSGGSQESFNKAAPAKASKTGAKQ